MEQWFDERTAGMIGGIIGSVVGITGGLIGSISAICVQKGWKKLFFTLLKIVITANSILLITGIIALICRQPYHVWFVFLLSGLLGVVLFSIGFPVMGKRFTEYELRKMQAKDL